MREEVTKRQAGVTRLLLHYTHAPFTGESCVRGVLPSPEPEDSIRIVTGAADTYSPEELTVYEIPLRTGGEFLTVYDILRVLRALHTGTHIVSGSRVGMVLGMLMIPVDPAVTETATASPDDRPLVILRTLAHPASGEDPDPRLLGFLCREPDLLRLYLDAEDVPGVLAADVRPSVALTALLGALPSLSAEVDRLTSDTTDPHASHTVDLTNW